MKDPTRYRFVLVSDDGANTIEPDVSFMSEKVALDVGTIRARDANDEAERKARSPLARIK